MSTHANISAVTSALQALLRSEADGAEVSAVSLAEAERAEGVARLNVFLYALAPAATNRHTAPAPSTSTAMTPPLALDLRYLISPCAGTSGRTAADLLEAAVQAVQQRPVLQFSPPRAGATAQVSIEPVPPLELAPLWLSCRAEYRPSVTCLVKLIVEPQAVAAPVIPIARGRVSRPA